MGEIWGRNGRETAVAEWRWGQEKETLGWLLDAAEQLEARLPQAKQEL